MTETCEHCGKQYVPNSDKVRLFKVCSEYCRGKIIHRRSYIKQIENNNYESMTVKKIKKLGFHVTVSKQQITRRNKK